MISSKDLLASVVYGNAGGFCLKSEGPQGALRITLGCMTSYQASKSEEQRRVVEGYLTLRKKFPVIIQLKVPNHKDLGGAATSSKARLRQPVRTCVVRPQIKRACLARNTPSVAKME